MAETLRIVIQVYDDRTMQKFDSIAKVVLTPDRVQLIQEQADNRSVAQWAAASLSAIVACLEDMK